MHRLINVSANSQFYSSEHNLKLHIVEAETDNTLHAYLDGENYVARTEKGQLRPWVHHKERNF